MGTFEDFFKANYLDVERRVLAAGASADTAAEATQEAFTRAYQRWWRLSHYGNPAAWVQRVALNHRIDLERRAGRQSRLVAAIAVESTGEVAPDTRVSDAVDELSPQQQAAVKAFYGAGMTTAEAADEMGISPGAVRFHLTQARRNLRPLLATETGQEV